MRQKKYKKNVKRLCVSAPTRMPHMIFKRDKFQNIAGAFQTTITRRNTSRDCLNKHFHPTFITTDKTSLHCLQVALKVWAKLAKVLKAAFSRQWSWAPVELSLLSAVTSNLNATAGARKKREEKAPERELEKQGTNTDREIEYSTPDGAPVLSAIVLYLAPLCSPLLTRLLLI